MKIVGPRKKIIFMITALLMMTIFINGCSNSTRLSDDAVATINGNSVSLAEYEKTLALQKMTYETQMGPDIFNQEVGPGMTLLDSMKKSILEKLILDEILIQEAGKKKIEASEEEIRESYDPFMEFVNENETFKEFVEENDIDEAYIKQQINKDIIIHKYRDLFIEELDIGQEAAREYYDDNPEIFLQEEVKAKHILVRADEDKAKERAQEILDQINNPQDFNRLWEDYQTSDEEGIIAEDLDRFGRGVMVPEFESAAFAMEANEISDLVESSFGFHIILVEDVSEETLEFEDMEKDLMDFLKEQAFQEHLEELLENAKIVKKEDL